MEWKMPADYIIRCRPNVVYFSDLITAVEGLRRLNGFIQAQLYLASLVFFESTTPKSKLPIITILTCFIPRIFENRACSFSYLVTKCLDLDSEECTEPHFTVAYSHTYPRLKAKRNPRTVFFFFLYMHWPYQVTITEFQDVFNT